MELYDKKLLGKNINNFGIRFFSYESTLKTLLTN